MQPEDVGLPRRGRRRVDGLRRHEVADLAAVSVTWYTWLEQGREINCTPQVLDALARALQLDEVGRRHLRRLGGTPVTESPPCDGQVDPALIALLDDHLPSPACLLRPNNDLVAWNEAYVKLFGDPAMLSGQRTNALMVMLEGEQLRSHLVDWELHCRQVIGAFRAEAAKHPGDPAFTDVVDRLTEASPLFRDAWPRHEVRRFTTRSQTLIHPDLGEIRMEWLMFRPLGLTGVMLMIHRLADLESRERVWKLLD